MTFVDKVREFMESFDQTTYTRNDEQAALYAELISEELEELSDSSVNEEELDAICDTIWVLIGLALSRGYDIEGAFDEVYRSNMSKMGEDGKPIYREDGKVLKGENYTAPDLTRFCNRTNLH